MTRTSERDLGTGRRGSAWTRIAGLIGAAGPLGFAVAAVAAQSLQVGYDPAVEDLSALAAQDAQHPWVMAAGILLLGTSVLALTVGLRPRLVRGEAAQLGGVILLLLGAALCAAAVLRNDCSTETVACAERVMAGQVSWTHHGHDVAAILVTVLFVACPLVLAAAFGRDPRWQHLRRPSQLAGVVGLVLLPAEMLVHDAGAAQRLSIAVPLLWLVAVAVRLTTLRNGMPARAQGRPQAQEDCASFSALPG